MNATALTREQIARLTLAIITETADAVRGALDRVVESSLPSLPAWAVPETEKKTG